MLLTLCIFALLSHVIAGGHSHSHAHTHETEAHAHGAHSHAHAAHAHEHAPAAAAAAAQKEQSAVFDPLTWAKALGATLLISGAPLALLSCIPLDSAHEDSPLLRVLLAFASGGLLGDVFLHLLPHTMAAGHAHGHSESHAHSHEAATHGDPEGHSHSLADLSIGMWILAGITIFLVIEKAVRALHGDSHGGGHSHAHAQYVESAIILSFVVQLNLSFSLHRCVSLQQQIDAKSAAAKKKNDDVDVDATRAQISATEMKVHGWLNLAADFAHNFTDG